MTRLLASFAICLTVAGCSGTGSRSDGATDAAARIETMPHDDPSTTTRSLPPIDAAAPAAFQTATFALG